MRGGNNIQWISDGCAMYPLFNMPLLSKQNIFTIFDVQESKRNDYVFKSDNMPDGYCYEDIDDDESMLKPEGLIITRMGTTLQPLKTSQGLVFINTDYLKPMQDVKDTMELFERTTESGRIYIAIKNGLLLLGIIQIYDIIDKKFLEQMESLTSLCKTAFINKGGSEGEE